MFTVIDTETGGLDVNTADVWQFAWLTFDSHDQPVDRGSLYFFREGMPMDPGASRVNGLTYEYLSQYKQQFFDNLIRMFTVMNNNILVGYNSDRYDIPLIRNFIMRNGGPQFIHRAIDSRDAMQFAMPLYNKGTNSNRWKKLTDVSAMFGFTEEYIKEKAAEWFPGITTRGAHDAVYDVTATALITYYCKERGAVLLNQTQQQKQQIKPENLDPDVLFNTEDISNGNTLPVIEGLNAIPNVALLHQIIPTPFTVVEKDGDDLVIYKANGWSVVLRNRSDVYIKNATMEFQLVSEALGLFEKLLKGGS